MSIRYWFLAATLALAGGSMARAADAGGNSLLAQYHSVSSTEAKTKALAWLKGLKDDEATLRAFDALWANDDRTVLDLVAETLALGDAEAAKLLAGAADESALLPDGPPPATRDRSRPEFYRSNLGLAYGRTLANRGLYQESLDVLRLVRPEQVVDPAAYHFHRAVGEYNLLLADEAKQSIARLGDVADAPARYTALAAIMTEDMKQWKTGDLAWIAKRMKTIHDRLAQAHAGNQTRKHQLEVIALLNKLIEEEDPPPPPGTPGKPGKPGPPVIGPPLPPVPQPPPFPPPFPPGVPIGGPGNVDSRNLGQAAWFVKLPEVERAAVLTQIRRSLPAESRELIENYQRRIGRNEQP
jgi:hypothetical protein